MANFYSQYYLTNTDQRTRSFRDPVTSREGEPVWIKANVSIPATAVAGDILYLGQVLEKNRPVNGRIKASAANGSLTFNLGYVGSASAILSASTLIQTATTTDLTAVQLGAVTYLPPTSTELIATLGGTVSLASNLEFWIEFDTLLT